MTTVDDAREALLAKYVCHGPDRCRAGQHDESCRSWMAEAKADLLAYEAAVRAERDGLVAAQRNVIGVAAGLDPAMDERLLRRLVGGLAMAARAALATPPETGDIPAFEDLDARDWYELYVALRSRGDR